MRGTYREQLDRTTRALARLREIYLGRVHDRTSDEYRDCVLWFFQNCHHLKDWLANDPSGRFASKDVEGYINDNTDLQLCADLCNGSKHLTIDRNRSAENPRLGGQSATIDVAAQRISISFAVETDGGARDALDLAERCTQLWVDFITRSGEITS